MDQQRAEVRERLAGLGGVEQEPATAGGGAAMTPDGLVDVAHQRLRLQPLPQVSMHPGGRPEGADLRERPRRGREDVGAMIEDTHVGVPGHSEGAALDERRLHRPREEVAAHRGSGERAREIGDPPGAGELGHPDDVDDQHVEVARPPFEGGDVILVHRAGRGRQQLGGELDIGVLLLEAGEQPSQRPGITAQRLVLEDHADAPGGALLFGLRAAPRGRERERAEGEHGPSSRDHEGTD